jgi:L-ascorbate metabolism protein UlaG (beta-lactamase superfamily)
MMSILDTLFPDPLSRQGSLLGAAAPQYPQRPLCHEAASKKAGGIRDVQEGLLPAGALHPIRRDGRYGNPNPDFRKRTPWAVAKWLFWDGPRRGKSPWSSLFPGKDPRLPRRPQDGPDPCTRARAAGEGPDAVTWIGHSTFLIRIDGVSILTDPVWSDRIFGGMGPRRLVEPGLALSALPPIDIVCISHNHYDHLDLPTIRKVGNRPCYLVPLGMERIIRRNGIRTVRSVTWWECTEHRDVRIHSVPAQHFSVRGLFDHDKTLWTGWVFQGRTHTVYFAGDTGFYSAQFRQIRERFPGLDAAILPIGAYKPNWLMQPVHLSPAEALEAFCILEAGVLIPCHWGTFKLSEEDPGEPPQALEAAARTRGIPAERIRIQRPGETLMLGKEGDLAWG